MFGFDDSTVVLTQVHRCYMIENYRVLAERIRFELSNLGKVIIRGERAMNAYDNTEENKDLFLDSVALSLHDFYTGLGSPDMMR